MVLDLGTPCAGAAPGHPKHQPNGPSSAKVSHGTSLPLLEDKATTSHPSSSCTALVKLQASPDRLGSSKEEEEEESKGSPLPASPSIWVLLLVIGVARALLAGTLAQPQLTLLFVRERGHARVPAENKSASWALRAPFSQLHPRHRQHHHVLSIPQHVPHPNQAVGPLQWHRNEGYQQCQGPLETGTELGYTGAELGSA